MTIQALRDLVLRGHRGGGDLDEDEDNEVVKQWKCVESDSEDEEPDRGKPDKGEKKEESSDPTSMLEEVEDEQIVNTSIEQPILVNYL